MKFYQQYNKMFVTKLFYIFFFKEVVTADDIHE